MYDKLIGAYHLGSQGSNHWTLVVRQSNYLCFNVVNVNVLTGVGAKIQQNNIYWSNGKWIQQIDESDTKKLKVREYAVTSVGSFQYARHYQDRFPMIKNLYTSFKGTSKIWGTSFLNLFPMLMHYQISTWWDIKLMACY